MNKIDDLINKFHPIKNKIEPSSMNSLFENDNISILYLLKKNRINNSLNNQKKEKKSLNKLNITNLENNPKSKSKEKNKFFTKKYPDQNNPNLFNSLKGVSPTNALQNNNMNNATNKQNNFGQNYNRNNNNNGNYSNNNYSDSPENINLLVFENGEKDYKDIPKIFEGKYEKEKQVNLAENTNKNEENDKNNKNDNNLSDSELGLMLDSFDEQIEEKSEQKKKNGKNLMINKKESAINFNEEINIFDETKLMGDDDDIFNDNNDDNNNENFHNNGHSNENNNNKDNDSNEEQRNNISKSKIMPSENYEKEKSIKHNIKNSNEQIKKELDNNSVKENNNNNILISSNNKFFIPLEEDNDELIVNKLDKEKNNKNEFKALNNPTKKENIEKKKKENHKIPISKKNIKSKSCINSGLTSNYPNKIYNKVIIDDEEEYFDNNKETSNDLYLSLSKTKNTNTKAYDDKITEQKETIISTEGNKFRFIFEDNFTHKKSLENDISEKNKKIINENENYDLLCINNINKILNQIKNRLKKENIEIKINEICFKIISRLKDNQNDLNKRKKNTYFGILKILEHICSLLCDIKKNKIYINEVCQLLEVIENYYIQIKKFAPEINNEPYYHNKKIAFKYIYSSLELRNYDSNLLKELISNNNKNENIDLIKFVKIYKRYKRTSEYLIKEIKDFKEKLNNPLNKTKLNIDFRKKYELCPNLIQTSPNFIDYKKLFNHYSIILNFFHDYKLFNEELEKMKKNGKINYAKRDRSMQINKNGISQNLKNRERSRYKEIEKEREIEKENEKNK